VIFRTAPKRISTSGPQSTTGPAPSGAPKGESLEKIVSSTPVSTASDAAAVAATGPRDAPGFTPLSTQRRGAPAVLGRVVHCQP